jgi:hypothetical protein
VLPIAPMPREPQVLDGLHHEQQLRSCIAFSQIGKSPSRFGKQGRDVNRRGIQHFVANHRTRCADCDRHLTCRTAGRYSRGRRGSPSLPHRIRGLPLDQPAR